MIGNIFEKRLSFRNVPGLKSQILPDVLGKI